MKNILKTLAGAASMLLVGIAAPVSADTLKVALVLPGNITDKSWNQVGYEGLMKAKETHNVEVAFSEKVAQPDQAEAMADYARRGYDLVIGHGGEFQEAADRIARRHPETLFIVNNGSEANGENVAVVDFNYRQFGYVLGYVAGSVSESGTTGFIAAQKVKSSVDLEDSYIKGFKAAQPDGKVLIAYTNDWDDIAKGKEAALNQINSGADVLFPTMDNAVIGSLQAAQENKVWAFGLYYDAIQDWPDTVLQSAIFDVRSSMSEYVGMALADKLEGKHYTWDLNTPAAARLGSFHPSLSQDVQDAVNSLAEKMKSGELEP